MHAATSFADLLGRTLDRYRAEVADNTDDLALLLERFAAGDALDARSTMPGHVTTSAIVVDEAGQGVLLVRHRSLGLWLQPGGHWEPAPTLAASAEREAREETGVTGLHLHPWHCDPVLPIDIDTHPIPANPRKGEPAHHHFDIRFAFVASRASELRAQEDEVADVAWRPFDHLAAICPRVHRRLGPR